jgi:Domain of unknown function (DUF1906)
MRSCRYFRIWPAAGLLAAVTVTGGLVLSGPAAAQSSARAPAARLVVYRGTRFTVPRSWRVVDLAAHPRQCVRFDRHTLYLGTPGPDQACPARAIGTTEALLAQPSSPTAVPDATAYPVDRLITVVTRRITVTATYATHRAQIIRILASASLPVPRRPGAAAPRPDLAGGPAARPAARPAALPASATDYTGQGFDACTAPSAAQMQTWRQLSPYRAVGIYIGGADRACAQPNLTASWVRQQQAAGWHFMPIYVGPQASFGQLSSVTRQAASAAEDAVNQARMLGFGPHTPLYYDMEAYSPAETGKVLRFLTSWTQELHAAGYASGVYSNSLSGIKDLADNYASPSYTMPDVIYDALWNGIANTADPNLPATDWAQHQRIHQYLGGQNVTYGGDTINIDQDYLDVQRPGVVATGTTPQTSRAAAQAAGDVDVFYRGVRGQLWHDWFSPGTGWHGPVSMGGSLAAQPSAVTSVPGTVAVFARQASGHLAEASYQPGLRWSRLKRLPEGEIGSRPVAVAQSDGEIDVFWRGASDTHLWHAEYRPGSGWAGPQDLGGQLASVPAPAVSGHGVLSVFWKGTDGHLWEIRRNPGSSWSRAASLGMGRLGGAPSATGLGNGQIDVFWPARSRRSVWHVSYSPGAGWGRAADLSGGGLSAGPFAVASGPGTVSVFWKGGNGRLWWATDSGSGWPPPAPLAMGVLGSGPFAAGQPGGAIDVFWKGSADKHLWHARHNAGSWVGPQNLGGTVG